MNFVIVISKIQIMCDNPIAYIARHLIKVAHVNNFRNNRTIQCTCHDITNVSPLALGWDISWLYSQGLHEQTHVV